MGRSICPSQFPSLESFHWEANWRVSMSCPRKSHETWTCSGTHTNSVPSTSASTQTNGNFPIFVVAVAAITFIIIHSIIRKKSWIQAQSLEQFEVWNVEKESKSESTEEDDDDEFSGLISSKEQQGGVGYDSIF